LPTSALVDRTGDLFVASPMRMLQNMTYVLGIRLRWLHEAGLPSGAAYLPVAQQKKALEELRRCWNNSAPGLRIAEKVSPLSPHRKVSFESSMFLTICSQPVHSQWQSMSGLEPHDDEACGEHEELLACSLPQAIRGPVVVGGAHSSWRCAPAGGSTDQPGHRRAHPRRRRPRGAEHGSARSSIVGTKCSSGQRGARAAGRRSDEPGFRREAGATESKTVGETEEARKLQTYSKSNTLSHSCRSGVDQLVPYSMSAMCVVRRG
jgi:hypothetical protein